MGNPILYTDLSGHSYCDSGYGLPEDCAKQPPILNPMVGRNKAVEVAQDLAQISWKEWYETTGFWTPGLDWEEHPEDPRPVKGQNCQDCTRFVSVILWKAGFKMDGDLVYEDDGTWYWNGNDPAGWWANNRFTNGGRWGELAAWGNADAFYKYWDANGATPLDEPADGFTSGLLQPGDVIAYDYNGDGTWDHLTMVTGLSRSLISHWLRGGVMLTQCSPK